MGTKDYEVILINTPLSDESGIDLAMQLAQDTAAVVIMLVKA